MKESKCWKILCSSPLFLLASTLHLSSFFLFQPFFYFSAPFVSVQRLFLPFFPAPHFFFSLDVLPFFQPKTFFSLAQTCCYFKLNTSFLFFFSGQHLLLFFFFFSYVFKGQPKTCCSPKSPLNLSNSCVPLCQDEVKPPASKPRGTRFSCKFSSQKKSSSSLHSSKIQYSL